MPLLPLVINRRTPLQDFAQAFRVEHLAGLCRAPDFFRQSERGATITIRHANERKARAFIKW